MTKKVEISFRTIFLTVSTILLLGFLYLVKNILMQFFIAVLVMTFLNPFVTKLSKYKIPRSVSVLLVYALLVAATSIVIASLIPTLIDQTSAFVNNLPAFIDNLGLSTVISDQIIQELVSQIATFPTKAAKFTISIFSNLLTVLTVLTFAYYLLVEREELDNQIKLILKHSPNRRYDSLVDTLETRLGGWARGQIGLMIIVGILNYIGLSVLGIPFALPLAILAGLLEIVPYIGPILAAIPAVVIGLGISLAKGLAVACLAFLVQQIENYILVPKIMQKSAGVNPIVTLLCLAIGFKLGGISGLLISIPVFITLKTLLQLFAAKETS